AFSDVLVPPVRKRMRAHRRDLQSTATGEFGQSAAQLDHMSARAVDRIANLRAQLHHRLVHLGLDLLLENDFSTLENFVNMRTQLARFRIDDGKLLFDTESKRMILCAHGGA